MFRILFVLAATSLAAYAAPAPKPAPASDSLVEAAIRAKYAKSKINEEHFKVTVKNGVALIEGQTSIPQRKGVATRLAKTGGAREVVNKIEVSEAARKQMADRLQKARTGKAAPKAKAAGATPAKTTAKPASVTESAVLPVGPPQPPPFRRMQIKP
jgi:hypothetical protein